MPDRIFVVSTGTANIASVMAGLRRAGASPAVTTDPDRVRHTRQVILPGVGALAAAMNKLEASGLSQALTERLTNGRPTLVICLGLQLLAEESDENPGVPALGVIRGRVCRFPDSVRVPQMGWNRIEPAEGCRLLRAGHAYFANSFRLLGAPDDWCVAYSDHGGPFVAALERGDVLACQFHPELSGAYGLELIRRWLSATAKRGPTSC